LQKVTALIGLEEDLVDLVALQLASSHKHLPGFVRQEVKQLVKTENQISGLLDRLAAQGMSSDAVYQDDVARLMKIEDTLADLVAEVKG